MRDSCVMKCKSKLPNCFLHLGYVSYGVSNRTTLSPDGVALIKSILTALRGIKVREIDKALVILSKGDRARNWWREDGAEQDEG